MFESISIPEWKLIGDIRLAALEQAHKDGPKEEGEVDEGDRVRSAVGKWHLRCQR